YIAEEFAQAFEMECMAVKRVRDEMGLSNDEIMVPFVRTVKQAESVVGLLGTYGLKRGDNGLRLIMMCEVPSNAILAEEI
ncbi:putative PEP-binding protein, partial [Burkholderia pseudomallei]